MFSFTRTVHFFYTGILVLLFFAVVSGMTYLWNDGPVRMDHVFSMVEASYELDELRSGEELKSIRTLVEGDQSRQVIPKFREWENRLAEINGVQSHNSYTQLAQSSDETYRKVEAMISLPEAASLIQVLRGKVESFESFVINNNWRTLTRISGRVNARLEFEESQRRTFFTERSLSALHENITADFERMRNVTINSVLSQQNKDRILERIDSMAPELEMLGHYTNALSAFNKSILQTEDYFQNWVNNVIPALSQRMANFQQLGSFIFFGLLGLASLAFLGLLGGQFVYKQNQKSTRRKVENIAIRTVRDGLIPLSNSLPMEKFSEDFNHEVEKYREYVHKRMSFGSVFQEAMPFSTIMLDNNLNLSWANSLFYEVWGLHERTAKEEPLSWDYLQQFTNLGEDDPILMALNEKVAGIYQIQVRTKDDSEGLPYEMYVSPVDYAGQGRIMIFFYPLRSIQETISHQVRSIVGPVGRTLDLLASEDFEGENAQYLQKDFEIAGIENLFAKFCSYDEVMSSQKQKLHDEVRRLNNKLDSERGRITELQGVLGSLANIDGEMKKHFVETRNIIISTTQTRESLVDLYKNTSQNCREIFKEQTEVFSTCGDMTSTLKDMMKSYEKITATSKELKARREELDKQRTRLIQSVEQTMIYQRGEGKEQHLEQSLGKIKLDVKSFDSIIQSLSKNITAVDVALSRLEMMMSGVVIPDLDIKQTWFEDMNEAIETEMFYVNKAEKDGHEKDDHMVKVLKKFHGSFLHFSEVMAQGERILSVNDGPAHDERENDNTAVSASDLDSRDTSEYREQGEVRV